MAYKPSRKFVTEDAIAIDYELRKIAQKMPTGSSGTITGVVAGTALTGGGTTGSVTLNVADVAVAQLADAAVQTSSESFADNDTSLMTSAAIQDKILSYGYITGVTNISGNAGTATALATARTINGVSFDGTADVTGNTSITGSLTVGVNDTGYDVIFYGATADKLWKWDASADSVIVTGAVFNTAKMQTGQNSFTQEPWSNSTIALGNFGSIGTQGSYRTTMAWNFERGTDSAWHHLDINSDPQAGAVEIGNSGIIFRWQADFETDHADLPTDVLIMDADALYPADDNVTDLGTSSKAFYKGVINYLHATDGSASYPSYAFGSDTNTGLYRYGADSLGMAVGGNNIWYVTNAGNNVWKTHTNTTMYNYFLGASHSIIYMGSHSSTSMGGIYVTSSGYLYTRAGNAWRTRQSSSEFRPYYDSQMKLGSSSARWTQLYADTSTISTSDVNLKTDIVDTPLGLDFIKSLRPIQYKWKKTDGGKDGVRDHQGLIAQEVKAILDARSETNASEQAMWCDFSVDGVEDEIVDQDDPEKTITVPAPTDQALRYSELIGPIIKAVQELSIQMEENKCQCQS